jgi:hypothetical protein
MARFDTQPHLGRALALREPFAIISCVIESSNGLSGVSNIHCPGQAGASLWCAAVHRRDALLLRQAGPSQRGPWAGAVPCMRRTSSTSFFEEGLFFPLKRRRSNLRQSRRPRSPGARAGARLTAPPGARCPIYVVRCRRHELRIQRPVALSMSSVAGARLSARGGAHCSLYASLCRCLGPSTHRRPKQSRSRSRGLAEPVRQIGREPRRRMAGARRRR